MIQIFKNSIASFVPMRLIINNFNPVLLYHSLGSNSKFGDNIDHVNLEILFSHIDLNESRMISIKSYGDWTDRIRKIKQVIK